MTHPVLYRFPRAALAATLALAGWLGAGANAWAATTALADSPTLATNQVPPNVMMTLSVVLPTGTFSSYNDNYSTTAGFECGGRDNNVGSCYYSSRVYLSYFDPEKCYAYDTTLLYFVPKSIAAANHNCSASSGRYSGNYLNWASAHALDGFRWTMTGGDRYIDTTTTTVIEKSYHTGQGGYNQFPIKRVQSADYTANGYTTPGTPPANVTPLTSSQVYSRVTNNGWPLGPGTTRTGRLVQFASNYNWLNDFANVSVRFVKVQLAYTNALSLAEVQVLQTSSAGWTFCANENFTCTYTGPGEVRYGNSGTWTTAQIFQGGTPCNNTVFGDPLPGQTKQCQYRLLNNLAQGRSTSQSSLAFGGVSSRAVDGNVDGIFNDNSVTHTDFDNQAWWQVDLGSAHTDIRAIVLFNRTDCCSERLSDFYVFAGPNDMSAKTVDTLVGDTSLWMVQQDPYPVTSIAFAPNPGDFATTLLNGRVKVCDSSVGLETNCTSYGGIYKPTGVLQDNADKVRLGVMGYLNVDGIDTMGGVLRSPLKYIGPNTIVPNGTPGSNPRAEITTNGTFVADPEGLVAGDIKSSGAINYINKFGKLGTKTTMKSQDTVSEMFLEALRYVRGATAATPNFAPTAPWVTDAVAARDGFPAYTDWTNLGGSGTSAIDKRPIQYACQRTYFVGIGDTNTWCDTYGPGDTHPAGSCGAAHYTAYSPIETGITSDIQVGTLTDGLTSHEGLGSLGSTYISTGRGDGYNISGYAWFANTHDLLPDDTNKSWTLGKQFAQTYWVDVRETNSFNGVVVPKNEYWLAGRYSGYTSTKPDDFPPDNYDPMNDTYFTGDRPDTLNTAMRAVFKNILSKQASGAPGALSTNNFSTTGGGYLVQYNSQYWYGDVFGQTLSVGSDGTPTANTVWTLATNLDAQNYDTGRKIFTYNPVSAQGVPFRYTSAPSNATMTATQIGYFGSTATIQQNVINYSRGQRTNEGTTTYRVRTHVLGDIVDAQPVYVGAPAENLSDEFNTGFGAFYSAQKNRTPMLYVGANDGMMHAIDATLDGSTTTAGTELWAYVPTLVLSGPSSPATPFVDGMASRSNVSMVHKNLVNGQALVRSVDFTTTGTAPFSGSPDWHSLLVGGLGKGGKGYYALDVTSPSNYSGLEATVAQKVAKWEYTDSEMGSSFGAPLIAKTKKNGWVVVLPSGYNTSTGKGFIVVLNAKTGALIQKIYTTAGNLTTPAGLAQINAAIPDSTDFTMDAVYAGDLLGNVWRFDMTASSGSYPNPVLMTTLKDASGNAEPITTYPKISADPTSLERWVFVGTGKLLDPSDLTLKTQQGFYAIRDGLQTKFSATQVDGTSSFPFSRSNLTQLTYSDLTTGKSTTGTQGWFFDFNGANTDGATERMVFPAVTNDGIVAFATQIPSTDPCSPGVSSRIYALAFANGLSNIVASQGSTTVVAYASDSSTLLKPEIVADPNGVTHIITSTGDTAFAAGPPQKQGGTGAPVRLNWREILQ